ncbi:hypothetical protein GLA29479_2853 [Lysobacter antibioticus]|nr:hypothetical protein GLA29479_2853 [Lysobacter antibioticus]
MEAPGAGRTTTAGSARFAADTAATAMFDMPHSPAASAQTS